MVFKIPSVKKLFSYTLITLLLLNVLGYYGVFLGLQYKNDLSMMRGLDAGHYDKSQTIEIKIPISLPYMPDQHEFARVDGKFNHGGEFYRLIEQKYAQDTLTVICIRDTQKELIHQALSDYVKTFADAPGDKQNSTLKLSFIKDYLPCAVSLTSQSEGWQTELGIDDRSNFIASTFVSGIVQPPERI